MIGWFSCKRILGVGFLFFCVLCVQGKTKLAKKISEASCLNLIDIYQLAKKNDTSFAVAEAEFKLKSQTVPQAKSLLLPNIRAQGNTSFNSRKLLNPPESYLGDHSVDYTNIGWSATLVQPIIDMSKIYNLNLANEEYKIASYDLAIAKQTLIYNVVKSYFEVLKATDQEFAARAHLIAVEKKLQQTKDRFEVGVVANTDVQEAQAAFDLTRVLVIQASNNVVLAKENLYLLTNNPIEELFVLDAQMPVSMPQPSNVQVWLDRTTSESFEVKKLFSNVRLNEKKLSLAKTEHLPTLSSTLSYGDLHSGDPQYKITTGSHVANFAAGLTVNIPIFEGGGTQSKIVQAGYQVEVSQRFADNAVRQIKTQTKNTFNTIKANVIQVNASYQGKKSAEISLNATQNGYEVGTRNLIDVLNSEDALYNSKKIYLESRYSYIINMLELKHITGGLDESYINFLSKWLKKPNIL